MNIGIELRYLVLGASGGVSQLVKGVCEELFTLYPEHHFFVFCTPFNRRLLDNCSENVQFFCLPIISFFQELDQVATEKNIQVLFRSFPAEDDFSFPYERQIFLIPDIQHEFFPDFFELQVLQSRRRAFSKALQSAGAIGTISEFAKNTLVTFPENRCSDIFLMPPSLQTSHREAQTMKSLSPSELSKIPEKDFLLFPANMWPHKNHLRLLQAFGLLTERYSSEIELVLTGHPQGWEKLSSNFPTLTITHLGFVRPELLRALLEKAKALVFFSLYEGFGMPLLEAFDARTPVVCSDGTSLPEVGGNAVLACDPTDVNAMADAMEKVLTDEDLREQLIQSGKRRLDLFSWTNSAQNLMSALKRVAARSSRESVPIEISDADPFPKVSIVTPSFNQGQYLQRTIDSVLQQDYPNLEYMVFDGGSTDTSVKILKDYHDKFYWVSKPDRGQTDAINKGLARSTGDILAYLNSDDVLLPGAIQKVVDFFKSNPDCSLVYGDALYIDENDNTIGEYNTDSYSFERLLQDCMICQPAAFWRRDVLDKVGLFDGNLNFAMDYDYWLRIAKSGKKIQHLPTLLACSRLYPETKTLSNRGLIYKEIFQICEAHAGYVHESYYHGYWNYFIFERNNPLSRLLRSFPKISRKIPRFHFRIAQLSKAKRSRFINLKSKIKTRLKALKWFLSTQLPDREGQLIQKITGYWPDNWLGPSLKIKLDSHATDKNFFMGGLSHVDLSAAIFFNGRKIGEHRLKANQYSMINFIGPTDLPGRLEIRFSQFVIDPTGRKLSFLLQETNVFTEQDLHV